MDATELQAISETLMRIVTPDMMPKQLIRAARHPNASKKDIAARGILFDIAERVDHGS
ncbi:MULTISPECIES: hypothetical protein [unclassified Mesorhizobium]|uniref:hypothetical protein n=1 Tax=unclassified Mesorhizobium TaxID=325217 RepID=UPI0015C9568E|nr:MULTISPECIES: hypothetical protein [unclassified Mesorhizobium]